jgi:hypothetical protein
MMHIIGLMSKVHDGPSSDGNLNVEQKCPAWLTHPPPHPTRPTTGNAAQETCLAPRVNIEARRHPPAASGPRIAMHSLSIFVHFRGVP